MEWTGGFMSKLPPGNCSDRECVCQACHCCSKPARCLCANCFANGAAVQECTIHATLLPCLGQSARLLSFVSTSKQKSSDQTWAIWLHSLSLAQTLLMQRKFYCCWECALFFLCLVLPRRAPPPLFLFCNEGNVVTQSVI